MKKILAALLVVVMVVSLFPATVFAANSDECKVVDKYGAHSKDHCDKLGVKYTKVGETVEPKCGQDGYTTYKCDACGTYFADDVIDMPEHEYERGAKPVTPRVEPTCSTYGTAAFFTCIHCDELFPAYIDPSEKATDENAPAGAIKKAEHHYVVPEDDCTAKKVCTVCGATKTNPNKVHKFDYNNPHAITKAPGTCGHGEAVFVCDDCGKLSDPISVIFHGHDENEIGEQLKFVKEKAATCTKTGVKAHYKCEECDALFAYNKEGKFVPVTAEDLVIEKTHSWGDEPTYSQLPTCVKYGADYYQCILCGAHKVEKEVAPLGHTTFEEALAHDADPELVEKDGKWITVTKAKSCTDKTTYEWSCHKECYCAAESGAMPIAGEPQKAICGYKGELTTKKDPAKGHTEKVVTVPATVQYPYEYTMILCTDPNCDAADVEGEVTETLTGKNYKLNVAVNNIGGNVYEMTEAEMEAVHFVKFTKVTAKKTTKCGAHYYRYNETNFAPTCTTTGEDVYICTSATCNYDAKVVKTAALGHDWDYSDYVCESKVQFELSCLRTGCTATKTVKPAEAVHKLTDEFAYTVKAPNCAEDAGDYYYCEYCEKPVVDTKSEGYKAYTYTSLYNSYKDAVAAHKNGDLTILDNTTYPGNCTKVGKIEYKCSECGEEFWAADTENTGHHIAPAGTPYHKEATCHNGQGYEDYKCVREIDGEVCGEFVKAAAPLDHILSELIPEVKATCTTDGNVAYYTCSRECCAYTVLDEDGKPVLDENGKEVKAPGAVTFREVPDEEDGRTNTKIVYTYIGDVANTIVKASGHDIKSHGAVAANCTTAGYEHFYCDNKDCGYEYVDNFVEATGHKKGTATKNKPTCESVAENYTPCTRTGCTGNDGILGTDDDGKATAVVVTPALGHINAADEVFYNKCTDTTKDRVCTRVNCDGSTYKNGKRQPIGTDCDMSDPVTVDACCEHGGYTISVCENGCGETVMVVDPANPNPLGHEFAWDKINQTGERAGLEFVNAADVEEYGRKYLEHFYRFKEAYGADAIKAYTPATYEKKGSITFTCADCGDVVTMDVQYVPVQFTIDMDNALVAGANDIKDVNGETTAFVPADGDIIAVNINMTAFETGVWGFNFAMEYDASAVNYLGYKFHAANAFKNTQFVHTFEDEVDYKDVNKDGVDELVRINKNADGVVKVLAYNDKKEDTMINGEAQIVTLYFQVDAYYEFTENGRVQSDVNEYFYFEFQGSITNAKGEKLADNDYGEEVFFIDELMDANRDTSFDINDIYLAIDTVLAGEGYIAGADINKNGAVDVDDIYLMCDYMLGNGDKDALIEVLLARKPWTAPEGFVAA